MLPAQCTSALDPAPSAVAHFKRRSGRQEKADELNAGRAEHLRLPLLPHLVGDAHGLARLPQVGDLILDPSRSPARYVAGERERSLIVCEGILYFQLTVR